MTTITQEQYDTAIAAYMSAPMGKGMSVFLTALGITIDDTPADTDADTEGQDVKTEKFRTGSILDGAALLVRKPDTEEPAINAAMDDLVERVVVELIAMRLASYDDQARAIIPMVLEEAAKAAHQWVADDIEGKRLADLIRAIGAP